MVCECPGAESMKDAPDTLAMSRFQLSDFIYDYPLDLNYFGGSLKTDELLLPPLQNE